MLQYYKPMLLQFSNFGHNNEIIIVKNCLTFHIKFLTLPYTMHAQSQRDDRLMTVIDVTTTCHVQLIYYIQQRPSQVVTRNLPVGSHSHITTIV